MEQGRFLLVVAVMRQGYERPGIFRGPFQKQVLPCFPGRFLRGNALDVGHAGHVRPPPNAWNTRGCGILPDELRFFIRLRAQAVVHMAGNDAAPFHSGKQGKQGHGIPAAADAGQHGPAGTEEFRRLAVKMVRGQRHDKSNEAEKRGNEKPQMKNPVFREENGAGKWK